MEYGHICKESSVSRFTCAWKPRLGVHHSRSGDTGSGLVQLVRRSTPRNRRSHTQAEGGLEVDVDTRGQIRQRDHVDVVRGVLGLGRHRGRLHEAWVTFAVAIDGRVNPIAHGHVGAGVRVDRVHRTLGGGCGDHGRERQQRGSRVHLHCSGRCATVVLNGSRERSCNYRLSAPTEDSSRAVPVSEAVPFCTCSCGGKEQNLLHCMLLRSVPRRRRMGITAPGASSDEKGTQLAVLAPAWHAKKLKWSSNQIRARINVSRLDPAAWALLREGCCVGQLLAACRSRRAALEGSRPQALDPWPSESCEWHQGSSGQRPITCSRLQLRIRTAPGRYHSGQEPHPT